MDFVAHYEKLFDLEDIEQDSLKYWLESLPEQLQKAFNEKSHGDLKKWGAILGQLPDVKASSLVFDNRVSIGAPEDCTSEVRDNIEGLLKELHPWRKGPFDVHGINIDTEWRSDWKWERLKDHIQPLNDRVVLDVGCGNGYHCWRMFGASARLVIGIDPTLLFVMQYMAIRHFTGEHPIYVLPFGIEAMPENMKAFDSVFSMGILYHRRSPFDHLMELKNCLRPGGELILETLVIEGGPNEVLVPEGRYAKMNNVWFIPSCATLEHWLKRCGFVDIKLVDVSKTTTEEQRSTDWMRFESLQDYLNKEDTGLTVEGLPAPTRAIFTATCP
ncbi:MAG: tRNA 5-methoxyuridine(34)/uridine 5-oxyacetic acid(34) synthase CmoB [Gammaproteobacteria bacterium]|nr:tRNA 5-methoxyuridine(34)/uridine 5-oxyacetic acid(34) synthase CmoB [Gammaproteobacteria bacterium]